MGDTRISASSERGLSGDLDRTQHCARRGTLPVCTLVPWNTEGPEANGELALGPI